MPIDFEAEGLLAGLSGRQRKARWELLEELAAEGVGIEELRRAVVEDRLALLPVERALAASGEQHTMGEVAELAGMEPELLQRHWRALGLALPDPADAVFTPADVEFARQLASLRKAGLPDEELLEMARVIAVAMAQVAAGARGLIGEALLRPGDTERGAARRFAGAARTLGPMMGPLLQYVFHMHLREQLRSDAIGREELEAGSVTGAQEVTVAFVDLVGFTRLGERLPVEELGAVTGGLAALVTETVSPPVRIVKMIGDAAMIVSPHTGALLDTSLSLVEDADQRDLPPLRAGVARGPSLARGGDWYGRPVNIASRVTEIARPASVVCSAEVREAAGGRYRFSSVGARRLKGIRGAVRLYRVRRGEVRPG